MTGGRRPSPVILTFLWVLSRAAAGADCNGNGADDALDLAPVSMGLRAHRAVCLEQGPVALAPADIDGDGDQDVAVARAFGITLLLNDGEGNLLLESEITIGSDPKQVTAADLDGDGDADLLTVNSFQNFSVFLNRGDGSFLPGRNHAAGKDPVSVAAADLDGDGDLDLAVANATSGDVSIFFNEGHATFEPQMRVPLGSGQLLMPRGIAAGDFDGDGDVDLLTIQRGTPEEAFLLLNDGRGSFHEGRGIEWEGALMPTALVPSDVDADGAIDLLVRTELESDSRQSVLLLTNQGQGTFDTPSILTGAPGAIAIAVADMDGDADPDLAVARGVNGELSLHLNDRGRFEELVRSPLVGLSADVAAVDMDGDGGADLVTDLAASTVGEASAACKASGDGALRLLSNDGHGAFGPPRIEQEAEPLFSLTPADFDGDGLPDLTALGATSIIVCWNSTRRSVSLDQNQNGVPDECEQVFRRGDAGGDGILDITNPILLLIHLHGGGPAPGCLDAADADDTGALDLTDAVFLLDYLFRSGPAPPAPGPTGAGCGPDTVPDGEPDPLGCVAYPPCG